MHSHPYTYAERTELLDNVRTRIKSYPLKHDPVHAHINKLCGLIEKHEFIASDDGDYKLNVE